MAALDTGTRRTVPLAELSAHAARRDGVFTVDEALDRGVSRKVLERLLREGIVQRLHRSVHRFTALPFDWRTRLRAAVAAAGPDGAASHRAAARWLGVPDVSWPYAELTVAGKQIVVPGATVHRSRRLDACDVTVQRGLRCTTGQRTIIDLAQVLDPVRLLSALDAAICAGVCSRGRLHDRARALRRGRKGAGLVVRVTAPEADGTFWSTFERQFGRLIRASDLPQPAFNAPVRHRGATLYPDALYDDRLLVIELQSLRFHSSPAHRGRDDERRNAFAEMGLRVVVVSWTELREQPELVLRRIAAALAASPTAALQRSSGPHASA